MTTKPTVTLEWNQCPSGTLGVFAQKQLRSDRRQFLTKVTGVAAACLLTGGLGYLALEPQTPTEFNYAGISCTKVRANGAAYMAGTLEKELAEKIRQHLVQCVACQKVWEEMAQSMPQMSHLAPFSPRQSCHCNTRHV